MGSLISGVIGGIGSMIGGSTQSAANTQASQQAMTGYNYLTSGAGAAPTTAYVDAGLGGVTGSQNTTNMMAQLLGASPVAEGTANAFNQYKDSTGYDFQMQSGQNALASSAAAKGLLNSGATAKALTEYGQNLGTQTFNNYLAQLSGLNSNYGTQASYGQNALGQVASAGTAGGTSAANYTQAAGASTASGIGGLFSGLASGIGSLF